MTASLRRALAALATALALAGCAAAPATTPTPGATASPLATPSPTVAPAPTALPAPTTAPSPSPTIAPTATDTPAPTATPTAAPTATATVGGGPAVECGVPATGGSISIIDFGFQPSDLTISAGQGVTWTNNGEFPHTVTFDGGPDCGRLTGGQTVTVVFREPGRFAFHCDIHASMTGAITVNP